MHTTFGRTLRELVLCRCGASMYRQLLPHIFVDFLSSFSCDKGGEKRAHFSEASAMGWVSRRLISCRINGQICTPSG